MKKKLIEVALPLEAINKEAAREKSIRHGHPSTLHLWWARRPLAACRAVLFASLVDDPSCHPDRFPTEAEQDRERQRLFGIIERLVKWDNSNNNAVLNAAHDEIRNSTRGAPPTVYDPFCGGGSIPFEALRLGLNAQASDLNPVAVLITKALIELPTKFAGRAPIHPMPQGRLTAGGMWTGARGLADDVLYYGQWIRDRAFERVGHHYPTVVPSRTEQGATAAPAVAWLWARTVRCPNPACGAWMPLIRSLALSTKPGKRFWLEPQIDHENKRVTFVVTTGNGNIPESPKVGRGAKFRCMVCQTTAPDQHIKDEGIAGRMGEQLLAIVAEGKEGRIYLNATDEQAQVARSVIPKWYPEGELAYEPRAIWCTLYGLTTFRQLFTPRQLATLTTFTDLIQEAREKIVADGGSVEYADAVCTYLAFAVDKAADRNTSLCSWESKMDRMRNTFGRQGLPMVWDFAETNPFGGAGGDLLGCVTSLCEVLQTLPAIGESSVSQLDAATLARPQGQILFSTDPPYYDNIGYADLSDFFYVWLRHSLNNLYPAIFSTLRVPKTQELIASPYRFGGDKERAQEFFEAGFHKAFERMHQAQNPDYPLTVYYAFKQSESEDDENSSDGQVVVSTGWETMLEGLLRSGFQVTGTWPMRSELSTRNVGRGTNALASSIVLACRPRADSAPVTTRKDFLVSLRKELPRALRDLQKGNIAPVDLAQAAIGPGMAVFSRYGKVLESDGSAMRVRTALGLINQTLDEVLSEQEGEFDPDTRWALAWFDQHAFEDGPYGEAEVLATAKALSVNALSQGGILYSRAGKVRLLRRDELPTDWNPSLQHRLTVWAVTQHLIRSLDKQGETATATLANRLGGLAETARDLAYRLYVVSERKGWAEEAGYYNSLVVSWPAIAPRAFQLS